MLHTRGPIFRVFGIILGAVIIVHGDIFRLVALVLGANRLLAMAKDISGLHPIVIGEVFFRYKNTYAPISLEYRALEVMKPSFLAFEPSLTYTLIGP
jgi:hypothetical protein